RGQFLAVVGHILTGRPLADQTWANRTHLGQVGLGYGAAVPATQGTYVGCDGIAMGLVRELGEVMPLTTAAAIVRKEHAVWTAALGRVEWPQDAPPVVPAELALMTDTPKLIQDTAIYFAVAMRPDGTFSAAGGTLAEIAVALATTTGGATRISAVNLGTV